MKVYIREIKYACLTLAVMLSTLLGTNAAEIDYHKFNRQFGDMSLKELNARGWGCIQRHSLDSAGAFYAISISRYSESLPADEMERVGIAFVNTGYLWLFIRNNPEHAYPFLHTAISIGRRHGIPSVRIGAGENLAKIYADYNNYAKAMSLYGESLDEALRLGLDWGITMTFIDMFSLAARCDRLDEIKGQAEAVARYPFDGKTPMGAYCREVARAAVSILEGDAAEAVEILESASGLLDSEYDRERYEATHLYLTGLAYMREGNYPESILRFRQARDLAIACNAHDIAQNMCESLAVAYMNHEKPDSAYATSYMALQMRDSLFSAARYDVIKNLESEASLSGMRKEIRDSKAREEKVRLTLTLISVAAVIALALLCMLLVYNRRLKESNRELFIKNMELAAARGESPRKRDERVESGERGEKVAADAGELEPVLEKVREVISTSREVFDADFSLSRVAELTGLKSTMISRAIAELTGKNLSTLIAERRIQRACRILADPDVTTRLTMDAIAESVGYKSRTYFSGVFKAHTGLTPTEFVRQAKRNC